jgi:CheY-like chemotaxis protein
MATKTHIAEAPLIFIVDDDASVRRSTGRLVRSLGMRAETFASAQGLLNSERLAEAACLILDVRMANMDGPGLHRRLRETRQRIPVVFFSARATKQEEDRALRSTGFFAQARRERRVGARDSYGSRNRKVKIISRITMTSLQSSGAPRTYLSDDRFRGLRDGYNI